VVAPGQRHHKIVGQEVTYCRHPDSPLSEGFELLGSSSFAVTSVTMVVLRIFTAVSRAIFSIRKASMLPSAVLGMAGLASYFEEPKESKQLPV
jgi:hypothetical protein